MKNKTTFYCFSPPVMLATFLVESGLLLYVLWRYKLSPVTRVAAALLAFLATFQLAEYYVCSQTGTSAVFWSRVGFVAITLLPPLGIHLIHLISKKPERLLLYTAYVTAAVWALVFGASEWAFNGHVCSGNYVIFQLRPNVGLMYSIYYYGWLLAGVWLVSSFRRSVPKKIRGELSWLVAGYFVFLVPTSIVNIVNRETLSGIPSIMCGFAVLFALILVFRILPTASGKRDRR